MTDTVEVDRELLEQIAHLLTKDGVYSEPVQSVVKDINECLDEDEDNVDVIGFYNDELSDIDAELTDRRNRLDDAIKLIKHIENDLQTIDCNVGAASISKTVYKGYIELFITIQSDRRCDEIDNLLTMDEIDGVSITRNNLEYKMDDEMNYLEWDLSVTISLRP